MAENDSQEELHCPWCHSSLGLSELPADGGAVECPGCQQRFYSATDEDDADDGPSVVEPRDAPEQPRDDESLDSYLERKIRGKIPERKETQKPATGANSTPAGWSKWEYSAPAPRKPGFRKDVRKADEAARLPKPLIEDLAKEKKVAPKFSELGHTMIPEEREIDSEQRRRRDVLQKGWEALSDPDTQRKGPTISKKDSLQFERNLISTTDREASPEDLEVQRHQVLAKEDKLRWEEETTTVEDPGDFSIERLERTQRFKSIIIGVLGAAVILATAIGLFIGISRMQNEASTTTLAGGGAAPAPVVSEFSVSANYNNIISKLRAFLEAKDVNAMLATVRNRAAVEPLATEYYKKHPYQRRLLRDVPSQDSILVTEGFAVVSCVVEGNERLMVPMEIAAGLKIDWEAVVGYSEMEWEDFAKSKPRTPVLFRVRANPVSYYNYGFTEDKYFSVQISDQALNHVFYGYLPRRGALTDEFVQLLPEAIGIGRSSNLFAVLELKFPDEDAAANQVEIVSLKARGWVYRRDLKATTQALELFANDARIDGGRARLDDKLRIADWDDSSTTLEWRVDIERPVQVGVFADLANGGSRGKLLSLSAGPQRIEHVIPTTPDWDTFREVFIGNMDFPSPGNYTFRLKHAKRIDEPLMVLDKLIFRAGSELSGSRVRDPVLKTSVHPIAKIPDLKVPGNTLTGPERAAGWRMLFTGKDLEGWTGYRKKSPPAGWSAQANQLLLIEPGCGPLITTEEFDNFEMKLEWQASDGQAGGVFFRVVEKKPTIEETGIEIELNGYGYSSLSTEATTPLTANGAVKHLYPAQSFAPNPSGWNTLHARFSKNEFQYWINDKEMGTFDKFNIVRPIEIGSDDWKRRVAESRLRRFQQFGKSRIGYIALEDAGTAIRFRNIKVLVLGKEQYRE